MLRPHKSFSGVYIDDIIIFSPSWEVHLKHLEEVFQALNQVGMKIDPKKSKLAGIQASYLGYVLGNGEIKPQDEKILAIRQTPFPKT